jgi:hypothetical protein
MALNHLAVTQILVNLSFRLNVILILTESVKYGPQSGVQTETEVALGT